MNTAILQKLDSRQLHLLMTMLLLILTVVLFTFLLLPQYREYQTALKTRSMEQAEYSDSDELNSLIQAEQDEISSLQKLLYGDMGELPAKQTESYIIGRLQEISWRNNIQLAGVKPAQGEKILMYQEMLFDVNIFGNYADLYRWLGDLDTELGLIVIKQYEIHPVSQGQNRPDLEVKLTMASYRSEQS